MIRLVNTYDQHVADGGDRIVIFRRTQDTGRGGHCAAWLVGRFVKGQFVVVNPKVHWEDQGAQVFTIWGRAEREKVLREAIEWANRKFGARRVRDAVGHRCPTRNCQWEHGFKCCTLHTRVPEFCLHCGAGIGKHRRSGEGTCAKCDPPKNPKKP